MEEFNLEGRTAVITGASREIGLAVSPMGNYANPKEITGTVLNLVSDAASFTTGTSLICDGGMLA